MLKTRYTLYFKDEDDGTLHALGQAEYAVNTSPTIVSNEMMDSFWDHRLDATSCLPVLESEEVEVEEEPNDEN
jgi:hypothetical protein